MSRYTTQKYINKKLNDITRNLPVMQSYELGVAVGLLEAYRYLKIMIDKETADKIFIYLDGDDRYRTILRTLIKLDDEVNSSTAERIADILENKRPNSELSDDDRDFLEEFMEFLYKKEMK